MSVFNIGGGTGGGIKFNGVDTVLIADSVVAKNDYVTLSPHFDFSAVGTNIGSPEFTLHKIDNNIFLGLRPNYSTSCVQAVVIKVVNNGVVTVGTVTNINAGHSFYSLTANVVAMTSSLIGISYTGQGSGSPSTRYAVLRLSGTTISLIKEEYSSAGYGAACKVTQNSWVYSGRDTNYNSYSIYTTVNADNTVVQTSGFGAFNGYYITLPPNKFIYYDGSSKAYCVTAINGSLSCISLPYYPKAIYVVGDNTAIAVDYTSNHLNVRKYVFTDSSVSTETLYTSDFYTNNTGSGAYLEGGVGLAYYTASDGSNVLLLTCPHDGYYDSNYNTTRYVAGVAMFSFGNGYSTIDFTTGYHALGLNSSGRNWQYQYNRDSAIKVNGGYVIQYIYSDNYYYDFIRMSETGIVAGECIYNVPITILIKVLNDTMAYTYISNILQIVPIKTKVKSTRMKGYAFAKSGGSVGQSVDVTLL